MKTFPMFLKMAGRRVVILGGGEQAAQKTRLMLKTEAEIVVVAPALEPELADLAARGRIGHAEWRRRSSSPTPRSPSSPPATRPRTRASPASPAPRAWSPTSSTRPSSATPSPRRSSTATRWWSRSAPKARRPSSPARSGPRSRRCWSRGSATSSRSPDACAPRWRPASPPTAAAPLGLGLHRRPAPRPRPRRRARGGAYPQGRDRRRRRRRGRRLRQPGRRRPRRPRPHHAARRPAAAGGRRHLLRPARRSRPARARAPRRRASLRRQVPRRDGLAAGPHQRRDRRRRPRRQARRPPQVRRPRHLRPRRRGRRRLRRRRRPWEIVPGVTAASAAAAEIGGFLTERGAYDSLVLTTGATGPGDPAPDWASLVPPGTTLALYMGVAAAPTIRAALLAGGAPPASAVEIVAEAATARARSWTTTLAALADTVARESIANPAIILVRLPKARAEACAPPDRLTAAGCAPPAARPPPPPSAGPSCTSARAWRGRGRPPRGCARCRGCPPAAGRRRARRSSRR